MANYRVRLEYDATRSVFVARAPELPSCSAEGETRAAALAALEQEIEAQVATMVEQGATAPTPVDEMQPPPDGDEAPARGSLDGRISAKVSPSLHRELLFLARAEGMPVDVLTAELLSESLALRAAREFRDPRGKRSRGGTQRDGNRRDGNRRDGTRRDGNRGPSYNQIMEDKASFLDYVRKQEQGQSPGNRRGRGRRRKRDEPSDE
jgi:predicted RNase H-like HicB family nuclease